MATVFKLSLTLSTDKTSLIFSKPIVATNLDLAFTGEVGKLVYDNYKLTKCLMKATVKDGKLAINPLKADVFGATVELDNMGYSYQRGGKPFASMGLKLLNMNPL